MLDEVAYLVTGHIYKKLVGEADTIIQFRLHNPANAFGEMTQRRHAAGLEKFDRGDLPGALLEFLGSAARSPDDWNAWYWAGQCERFQNNYGAAVEHLRRAETLAPQETSILLALGIALQLDGRLDDALGPLVRATWTDPDFAPAYNSLGVTHRKMGNFEAALKSYEAGTAALARTFAKQMVNSRNSPIFKTEMVAGSKWLECATFGALYSVSSSDTVESVAWPTGDSAIAEEETEAHEGLFFFDDDSSGSATRVFLPNYFNSFREYLSGDSLFANLVGNQGEVYRLRGEESVAEALFAEATEFQERNRRRRPVSR